ncbi:MAG: HDOD domain-containing protein [Inhella sp.]|jgi:HD-like signal output (HDOD) protein|uniref:HDOD domain-containing protein n=1 Tax=Inhella sp. TaxID=1921806 RepID=UPI0022BD0160|nr:HDOD domain-containing protein [Inhella sp.]MCZ8235162.1 HDOD domain-containing protein [Inhella sp.]
MQSEQIQQELTLARDKGPLREIKIPPCPDLLRRLRNALSSSEPDMTEVQSIAAADVAMSGTLIRVANSPVHLGDGAPCVSVGQALMRLGIRQTTMLMQQFLVRHAIPVNSTHLQRFWERSAKRAICMEYMAQRAPDLDPDLAASHGLFCHVGLPVLLQSVKGYGGTMVEAAARIDRPYVVTEDANHRTNHAVVGALVVRAWGFPSVLMASVRLHHDFTVLNDREIDPEVPLLVAAGLVAEQLMREHESLPPDSEWLAHRADALHVLRITDADLQEWGEELTLQLDYAF